MSIKAVNPTPPAPFAESGCGQHRDAMILLQLRQRIQTPGLNPAEHRRLAAQIDELETKLKLD